MSNQTDIKKAIFNHIESSMTGVLVWPNVEAENTLPYIEIMMIPAPTEAKGINDSNFYTGFTQINVVFDSGYGTIIATEKVDEIISLFPRGLKLKENETLVEFNKLGYQSPPIQNGNTWVIPVTIEYNVYGD